MCRPVVGKRATLSPLSRKWKNGPKDSLTTLTKLPPSILLESPVDVISVIDSEDNDFEELPPFRT